MIQIDISKCTGCRRCETSCAFFHTGCVNSHRSRIKVLNLYESGIDGPVLCVNCQERFCLHCPEEALTLGSLGQVVYSPTLCTRCGACEKSCPIGAIEIFSELVHVCDLCGGRPRCVEACTEGAILDVENQQQAPSLAQVKKHTRNLNPSLKRRFYLEKKGTALRKIWRDRRA